MWRHWGRAASRFGADRRRDASIGRGADKRKAKPTRSPQMRRAVGTRARRRHPLLSKIRLAHCAFRSVSAIDGRSPIGNRSDERDHCRAAFRDLSLSDARFAVVFPLRDR
jgi:hypothetical protein